MSDFMSRPENEIIEILGKGLRQSEPPPSTISEFAKALFTWRNLDAELAALTYDSVDEDLPAGVRSTATARMVSFGVEGWTIDLEYDPATMRMIGRVSPDSLFSVDLHAGGARTTSESDPSGRFEFGDVAAGPVSLVFRFEDGSIVKTSWIVL